MSGTPSILMKAASLIIGTRIRFTTKPAASLTCTGVFPISSAIFLIASTVSKCDYFYACDHFSSFHTVCRVEEMRYTDHWTGKSVADFCDRKAGGYLMQKCIPGFAILSSSLNVVFLTSMFSNAASTIRSQSAQRSSLSPG